MSIDVITRNHVKVSGRGTQPIVFAHGFGCDQNMWRFVAPAFEDEYRVVTFDYVGAGKSDLAAYDPARYSTLAGYARDLVEVCEALDLRDAIVVGHSVSSMIAVLAANQAPERFRSLIMIGPSPRYINDEGYVGGFERADIDGLFELMDRNYIGWANFLAPVVMKNDDRPELAGELNESFCSTDPMIARRFAEATFYADNRGDLAGLKHPALILQCAEDAIAPVEVGAYLHRTLPQSTFRQMRATGHCPHISHPEETIEAMKAYLSAS
jgi:sigma-B regulation protein RsbQ